MTDEKKETMPSNGEGEHKAYALDAEAQVDELRRVMNIPSDRPLQVTGIGAGAWGAVFIAMLQKQYKDLSHKVRFRIWRREGRKLDQALAEKILSIINSDEEVIRRLRAHGKYFKYVDARMGDRELRAEDVLADGFCVNMLDKPLVPLTVVTDLLEAVWDADLLINSMPSTETRSVFATIGTIIRERGSSPLVISLAKGVEFVNEPHPHIITPSGLIRAGSELPAENIMYLGGPNIASEVWKGEYATARICGGSSEYRLALANFCRTSQFVVWDNPDIVNHEVMGGLKNVYAIGAGIVKAATNNSATSMAVYFSNACAEMVFISQLTTSDSVYLAGPLLADVYVTLLKGRNSWYGEQLALGHVNAEDGAYIAGKGLIQGVSAVGNFYDLLSDPRLEVINSMTGEKVVPITLLPTLQTLKDILSCNDSVPLTPGAEQRQKSVEAGKQEIGDPSDYFMKSMKNETASDPAKRLKIPSDVYMPMLTEASTTTV